MDRASRGKWLLIEDVQTRGPKAVAFLVVGVVVVEVAVVVGVVVGVVIGVVVIVVQVVVVVVVCWSKAYTFIPIQSWIWTTAIKNVNKHSYRSYYNALFILSLPISTLDNMFLGY